MTATTTLDPRISARVGKFLATLTQSPVRRDVLGVVVTGSAARGEEIWSDGRLDSDIDLMVLTRRTSPRLIRRIDALIGMHRDDGIDGGQTPLGPLRRYLTLSFFEARANGVVVYGDVDMARLIPATEPAELPLWEAVRVLANRLVEHVKYDDGQLSPARTVAKSYEALAEAHLVAEGRYRPSYAERLAEIEHATPDAPPAVVAGMVTALRDRLGGPGRHRACTPRDVLTARAHLVAGLSRLASAYTGRPGDAATQLGALARSERHWRHRLYWTALLARQGRWAGMSLSADPILRVWWRALSLAMGASNATARRELLRDWRACPQILTRRPTA